VPISAGVVRDQLCAAVPAQVHVAALIARSTGLDRPQARSRFAGMGWALRYPGPYLRKMSAISSCPASRACMAKGRSGALCFFPRVPRPVQIQRTHDLGQVLVAYVEVYRGRPDR
jgi:hypothetical protein